MIRSCVVILLAALTVGAGAQSSTGVIAYRERSQENLLPGISTGVYTFNLRRGQGAVDLVGVNLANPRVYTDFAFPIDGVLQSTELGALTDGEKGRSAVGLEPPPAADVSQGAMGLRYERDAVYTWPPQGLHLMLRPEGTATFTRFEPGRGVAQFDDGTSLTLTSLNGALPTRPGEASVYTGVLQPSFFFQETNPANFLFLKLGSPQGSPDPYKTLLLAETGKPRWELLSVEDLSQARLERGEMGLAVLSERLDWAVAAAADRRRVAMTITLDPRTREARVIAPVGDRIVEDGLVVAADPEKNFGNALVLDPGGSRLLAVSAPGFERRRIGINGNQLLDLMREDGYTEAVEIAAQSPMVLPDAKRQDRSKDAAVARVRSALVFREGVETLEVADVDGELRRVTQLVVEDLGGSLPWNGPGALRDLHTGFDGGLGQFWAAPWSAQKPCGVRMRLGGATRVAIVEIVHASSAGFSDEFSLKSYVISGREKPTDDWRELLFVDHDEPVARERLVLPGSPSLSELRLDVTQPNFLGSGDVARIAEIYLWES